MKRVQTAALAATVAAVLVLAGSLVQGMWGRAEEEKPAPTAAIPEPPSERVRVEVLNAGGVPGAARDATRLLRARGFDVVYFGNGRGFGPDTSQVIDRAGREGVARDVADALDISRVRSRPDTTLYLEVTVVLGRDWKQPAATP